MTDNSNNILRTFLRRLTNLAGNNRSLFLPRLSADQFLDVHALSFLNGEPSFSVIQNLIAGKAKKICPITDSRSSQSNEVSVKIKHLQRVDRFIFEERGSNDLHVGWPFLRGKFSDGTDVRCPLLYFPVELVQQQNHWVLQPRDEAGILLNKTFFLAYAHFNKIRIDEELLEFSLEDFNRDSLAFRTALYELLKDKVEVHFNPDNFRDELQPFAQFRKQEFEAQQAQGQIKLFPEAVLGIFPQSGSRLVPDYLQLINEGKINDLDELFQKQTFPLLDDGGNGRALDISVKEEKIFAPFHQDAWQEHALLQVKKGRSLVVQGPPGTGKSQLICNLIGDAIASGKKVLVVCQKRAALDVVYKRLNEIGLGDFLGLVHDYRSDRKGIFEKIAKQIDQIEGFQEKNRSIDIIRMERRFFQVCREIDQVIETLESFRKDLYDEEECGLSVKELYLSSDLLGRSINLKQEYRHFDFRELPTFLRKLKSYCHYAARFEPEGYPWKQRLSFAEYGAMDMERTIEMLRDIPRFMLNLARQVKEATGVDLHFDECESLLSKEENIHELINLLEDRDVSSYFTLMASRESKGMNILWLTRIEQAVLNCYDGYGPEKTLLSNQLGTFQEVLHMQMEANKYFFRRLRWNLFSEHRIWVRRVLVANGFKNNSQGLLLLEEKMDNRLNLEHQLTLLRQTEWLGGFPENGGKSEFQGWFTKQKQALRALLLFSELRELRGELHPEKIPISEIVLRLQKLLFVLRDIPAKQQEWFKWLSPYQVRMIVSDPTLAEEHVRILKRDFDSLCEYDKLKATLSTYETETLSKLSEAVVSWDEETIAPLFQNSLRLAWIDHIETKFPILRMVSSMKMEEQEASLQQLVREKQELSKEILLLRARERVYENMEFNRLNNRVTYRDLYHQVSKKKKLWPVRKLIATYHDELFRIVPCWLASPESVSAIFPMEELFDLVIFDEASQCFAERGIPSMYRGRQCLIAGDSMQLRPNELYQVRLEDESEQPEAEVESLLELAERFLETVLLQGHYRSHSMELINFSNHYFYHGKLRLLPDRNEINKGVPPIEYCKVEGVWEGQTNRMEAETIVEKIAHLQQEAPGLEIGVVTFNMNQQALILDLLDEKASESGWKVPESLFVKNIENVQGDEKDVIIFSIGYAPDKKGKMSMQFGSLNMVGGENRLNVAVTRARLKVIVVCSVWPEAFRTEKITNDGAIRLKQYLEYARAVSDGNYQPDPVPNEKPSTWYLNEKLKTWGSQRLKEHCFETGTLPFCDLHIKSNRQYVGAVLTDDARYHEGLTVKDSHAYTPLLLHQKHWPYCRVFSRNYWSSREKTEHDLMIFVGSQSPS